MAGDSLTVSPKVAVVVDAETRARIAEAVITVDDREIGKTLWNGSFLIPDSFALLTIKKPGLSGSSFGQRSPTPLNFSTMAARSTRWWYGARALPPISSILLPRVAI